ncbi:MAG: DUF4399 domain-containing protein [Chitinophagaceae bacterium]|nr:MAG: DUF4399 domain-containing protein [Chitinophagaceae bacterium]
MKKYFSFAWVLAFALIACNNETEAHKNGEDHPHATTATEKFEMPSMPEVPNDATVFFENLKEGQTVGSSVAVKMGVTGLSVDTANGILKPSSGHHHILIDLDSVLTETVIPKDSIHLHFGNAQTSAEIKLPKGKHKLTLQFADALHRSYGAKLTSSVFVNVKE